MGPAEAGDQMPRPELQSATLVSTTAATTSQPGYSTVVFEFDELLTDHADRSKFVVYDETGQPLEADSLTVSGRTVTARYGALDTRQKADVATRAATPEGAVADQDGNLSPSSGGPLEHVVDTALPAGRTTAPDLLRASHFTRLAHDTSVRLLLDEYKTFDRSQSAFELRMTNGRVKRSIEGRYTFQMAPHRQMLVTARFPGHFRAAAVARAAIEAGAITWTEENTDYDVDIPYANPLQSVDVLTNRSTPLPDLVAVRLQHRTYPAVPTKVTYVFDQPVHNPRADRFSLFRPDSTSRFGSRAAVTGRGRNRVVVTFGEGALDSTVGAVAARGAVEGSPAGELSVAGSHRHLIRNGNGTPGPDPLGAYTEWKTPENVVFGFDENVAGEPVPAAFHVYKSDGSRIDATACTVLESAAGDTDGWVRCTFPPDSTADAGHGRLAAVSPGAVVDADGNTNPEGSEAVG